MRILITATGRLCAITSSITPRSSKPPGAWLGVVATGAGEVPLRLVHLVRSLLSAPDTGSFASDVRTMLRSFADLMDSEYGELLRGVLAEVTRSPELAAEARKQLLESGPHLLDEIYRRGIERGEVRPELRGTRVMTVAHDLLRNEFMTRGTPIEDTAIEEILDTVYLPLVRAR